jgi:predicted transcriptional regulator
LSIKPEFANAIFAGKKRFEFRRVVFKQPVDVVVVYASSPVQQVIGEFDVEQIVSESVEELWESTKEWAGIDRQRFFDYFEDKDTGFAIEIGEFRLYEEPLCLDRHLGVKPPQSFQYLDFSWPLCPIHGVA